MCYSLLGLLLSISLLLYFRIATHFNIIDKPNERSSHTQVTIRGGGVVFLVAGLYVAVFSGFQLPLFWSGFFLMGLLGFADDVLTLSSKIRLPLQLLATCLLLFQVFGAEAPWWWYIIALVVATGVTNAYNFMDGINGITAAYSVVVLGSLLVINQFVVEFVAVEMIGALLMAALIFGFYNFRKKARCFAGDVGSVSMAFAIVYLLLQLMVSTGSVWWILLLLVYGVDTVLTIVRRLLRKENIFEAHRQHLYQWMTRPGPFTHLQVAGGYALVQAVVSALLIWGYLNGMDSFIGLLLVVLLGTFYLLMRRRYITKYQGRLT
jgi:UDP-N-acetylmuramyl pentapeptide phosphotransferase/UDP-N-acetylglucosamine-1-phosphate transferase